MQPCITVTVTDVLSTSGGQDIADGNSMQGEILCIMGIAGNIGINSIWWLDPKSDSPLQIW